MSFKKINILNRSLEELKADMVAMGEQTYRGEQVFRWLYQGKRTCVKSKNISNSFSSMTNLPISLISKLEENYILNSMKPLNQIVSKDQHTIKYLFLLEDNNIIESVIMKYNHGNTLCLSTQVGCAMGCRFCASTINGLVRNLTPGEMMEQVLLTNQSIIDLGWGVIKNLVLMGSGEPLDNYTNTMKFLKLIHDPKGFNLSYRNITLSTCGLVPKIYALAEEKLPINLAISLHASNDEIRRKIMPIANAFSIEEVIKASRFYYENTGRRITFEYALIRGMNDGPDQAEELASILKNFACHVNLIPLNENSHTVLRSSSDVSIQKFISILRNVGINVTCRREMGQDIDGACGQLKARYMEEVETLNAEAKKTYEDKAFETFDIFNNATIENELKKDRGVSGGTWGIQS
ncbi:MAG: 23S rRNA (adenine(2503)-C(2))-methyltransferase RlmN [Clostridiales bacterium]|jgi:23S rRNA (adenine2503-C2)-methyltransferase|nr:23S rRNA (adenine(2503)-C(2))-methyltransferase RlmN [Clostridiales bacterium]